ncbi:MAG: general secretion pathway protein GspK, partial [Hyphomicrobiales bacterium]|nr:general secretion pathway protein GspK [Hyphomicrobiales bacterium]
EGGFVLLAVLWMIAALAALASIYLAYARTSAAGSGLPGERLQAEAALHAGLELAAYHALAATEPRQKAGHFETPLGRARVTVDYLPESARINLNAAPKELLSGLIATLGLAQDKADEAAAHIIAWRGGAGQQAAQQEIAVYQAAKLKYGPRQGPFGNPLELSLVVGLPEPLVHRILQYVTIYSDDGRVDALDADPTVLSALPQMTPDALAQFLKLRADPDADPAALAKALGAAANFTTQTPSKALRAEIVADFGAGRRYGAEIVFSLNDKGDEPFDVLDWRDDLDGAPPA